MELVGERARDGGRAPPLEFTESVIRALARRPPSQSDELVRDALEQGLYLKKTRQRHKADGSLGAAGTVSFVFIGRVRGVQARAGKQTSVLTKTLGKAYGRGSISLGRARAEARHLRESLARGIDPVAEDRARAEATVAAKRQRDLDRRRDDEIRAWTVGHALEQMLATDEQRPERRLKPASVKFYRQAIRYVEPLRDVPVIELKADAIRAALNTVEHRVRRNRGSTDMSTAQTKARRALSAVCNYAIRRLELNIPNPVSRLDWGEYRLPERRDDFLDTRALGRWLHLVLDAKSRASTEADRREAETMTHYLVLTALHGTRKEELMRMEWAHIDWKAGTFTIPVTKKSRHHCLPMSQWTRAILKYRFNDPDRSDVYVFPGRKRGQHLTSVRKRLRAALGLRSDAPDFRLHDLRRTLNTHAYNLGITGLRLKEILNHFDPDMQARYYVRDLRQVLLDLESYSAFLRRCLEDHRLGLEAEEAVDPDFVGNQDNEDADNQPWPGVEGS